MEILRFNRRSCVAAVLNLALLAETQDFRINIVLDNAAS